MKKLLLPLAASFIVLLTLMLLTSCMQSDLSATAEASSTPFEAQALLQERCTACHSLDRIASAHKTAQEWATTVERMIGKGARLNAGEQQVLIDYLAQTYP